MCATSAVLHIVSPLSGVTIDTSHLLSPLFVGIYFIPFPLPFQPSLRITSLVPELISCEVVLLPGSDIYPGIYHC